MEGRGSFPHTVTFQNDQHLSMLRTRPPFFWAPNLVQQPEIWTNCPNVRIRPAIGPESGFRTGFSSATSSLAPSNSGHAAAGGALLLPVLSLPHGLNFSGGVVLDRQNGIGDGQGIDPNPAVGPINEQTTLAHPRNPRRERRPSNSPMNLIKGQWSEEEDSKLKTLVSILGVKKWAQVAESMDGRVGKQCRERWHNHLRPDIKKDAWTEEEEMQLVEAHKQVGNRWAEIAKRIPGRTENSIKNHWNATKRKLNSRRRPKKSEEQNLNIEPTELQKYVKTTIAGTSSRDSSSSGATNTGTAVAISAASEDLASVYFHGLLFSEVAHSTSEESPPYLAHQSHDDELSFMQKFFGTNAPSSSLAEGEKPDVPVTIQPAQIVQATPLPLGNVNPTTFYNANVGLSYNTIYNSVPQGFSAGNMGGLFPGPVGPNQQLLNRNQQVGQPSHAPAPTGVYPQMNQAYNGFTTMGSMMNAAGSSSDIIKPNNFF